MEIHRADFDRILKEDRSSEKGRVIDFCRSSSACAASPSSRSEPVGNACTQGFHARAALPRTPSNVSLGCASFSNDYVYLILGGEARLLCAHDGTGKIDETTHRQAL